MYIIWHLYLTLFAMECLNNSRASEWQTPAFSWHLAVLMKQGDSMSQDTCAVCWREHVWYHSKSIVGPHLTVATCCKEMITWWDWSNNRDNIFVYKLPKSRPFLFSTGNYLSWFTHAFDPRSGAATVLQQNHSEQSFHRSLSFGAAISFIFRNEYSVISNSRFLKNRIQIE